MQGEKQVKRTRVRIGNYLNEVITIRDKSGDIIHSVIRPVMVEFYPRDVIQVILGALLLAVPMGFSQEVWELGIALSWLQASLLLLISILSIGSFVYYNYYRGRMATHAIEYFKRVTTTYVLSAVVVAILLTIIDKADWIGSWEIAIKRTILAALPAAMSAAVADVIK